MEKADKTLTKEEKELLKLEKNIKYMTAKEVFTRVVKGQLPDKYFDVAIEKGLFKSIGLNQMLSISTRWKNELYMKFCIDNGAWVVNKIKKKEEQIAKLQDEIKILQKVADENKITADPVVEKMPEDTTELMVASAKLDLEKAKELIEKNVFINSQNKLGNTALIYAVVNKHVDMINLLLEAGADPEIKNRKGSTALKIATDEIKKILRPAAAKLRAEEEKVKKAAIKAGWKKEKAA